MIEKLLHERKLMPIWEDERTPWDERRKEITKMLCSEEYGFLPGEPINLSWKVLEEDRGFCAGKVTLKKVLLKAVMENGTFSFPVYTAIPNENKKHPFFVHINFRDNIPDKYLPLEEICDRGFAVLNFCYTDVTSDDNDFSNGLAGVVYNGKARHKSDGGKIALWSWAASRVMDYAKTINELDLSNGCVVGHSRLGKTALLTGALDKRFSCAISNNSGCSGAAISRKKQGESIRNIYDRFPFWFCENFEKYLDNPFELPFDQHFLLAALAGRRVYVSSAAEDLWADPDSEFLSCVATDEVYKKLGLKGFVYPDRLPQSGDSFHEGKIGYHLRKGIHYLSREDWINFMKFLKK